MKLPLSDLRSNPPLPNLELGARIALGAIAMGLAAAGIGGTLEAASQVAALVGAYAVLAYFLDRRGMHNSGIAGLLAVADMGAIAVTLAACGRVSDLGVFVLAPLVFAATYHRSDPASMAPLGAGWVLVAAHLNAGPGLTEAVLLQAAGVLAVGLLLNRSLPVVREVQEVATPVSSAPEVRELHQELRQAQTSLRRDQATVRLLETYDAPPLAFSALAEAMRDLTGAAGVAVYSLPPFDKALVAQGWSGVVPKAAQDASLPLPSDASAAQLQDRLDKAVAALEPDGATSAMVLKHGGRPVGCLALFDDRGTTLRMAQPIAEEVAPALALRVRELTDQVESDRRLREAELLYLVAGLGAGADTPTALLTRVTRELQDTLRLDHLGAWILEDEGALAVCTQGEPMRLLDAMSFSAGPGVDGWKAIGAPELDLPDTYADGRVERGEPARRRIGSFAVLPLRFESEPYGFLTAAMRRTGGLDVGKLDTLRVVSAELGQAIGRLLHPEREAEGLASPKEFYQAVAGCAMGSLVYLEVPRRESLVERFGRAAVEIAVRRFAVRLRAKLPRGGLLCRRDEGDYVVLLRGALPTVAASWANEVAATASMIGIPTPDGKHRIPLALRAKVAPLTQQNNRISAREAA